MNSVKMKLSELKLNPNNPRLIKDDKFAALVQSVKDFPEMLEIRPIVVNGDMIILGGNMRYKACVEAWIPEVPVIVADYLTPEQQREFLIKDNVSGGEWDWDILAKEWKAEELKDWGLDIPVESEEETGEDAKKYTGKVEAPIYSPSEECPAVEEVWHDGRAQDLREKIDKLEIPEDMREFLVAAAGRFTVFNYAKIADLYAHSDKETQSVMEDLALVIVDFDKAIENGFVKLSDEISNAFQDDKPEDE